MSAGCPSLPRGHGDPVRRCGLRLCVATRPAWGRRLPPEQRLGVGPSQGAVGTTHLLRTPSPFLTGHRVPSGPAQSWKLEARGQAVGGAARLPGRFHDRCVNGGASLRCFVSSGISVFLQTGNRNCSLSPPNREGVLNTQP